MVTIDWLSSRVTMSNASSSHGSAGLNCVTTAERALSDTSECYDKTTHYAMG